METPTHNMARRFVRNRAAVATAGTLGFLIGAGGFVAAQEGADDPIPDTTAVETTIAGTDGATTDATSTTIDDSGPDTTIDDSLPDTTIDDSGPDTTIDDSLPDTTIDDSLPDTTDATPTTIDDSGPDTTIDDDATTTSVSRALPTPFTETYQSAGGSMVVSWSGTALSIDAISPAPGFSAEIEDNAWDKIRVDFEDGEDDARIEVRFDDGRVRVRID